MDYEKLYSGEHLKKINPNWTFKKWSYRHSFISKMKFVEKFLSTVPKSAKILDLGCGQGLLVEEFLRRGYDIKGIDAFYESKYVIKEDIFKNSFAEKSFDLILCLDVIEHFAFEQQEKLVKEIKKLLRPGGRVLFSIPNMAHLSSRIYFFFFGRLLRTAKIDYHPGDRPINEYLDLITKNLRVRKIKGISPTIPIIFQATQAVPQYTGWLYFLMRPFSVFYSWCFNVLVLCSKIK